jgi:hypothetical protein
MALPAVHRDDTGKRAAPADLDCVSELSRIRRLADDSSVPVFALGRRPLKQFQGTVDRRALLVARDEERDGALEASMPLDMACRRRQETGDAAFHVDCAAAIHLAGGDFGGEG